MEEKIFFNDNWLFCRSFDESQITDENCDGMEKIMLPHTVCVTPFNNFDEECYQFTSCYKKIFTTQKEWENRSVLLTIEAAAHHAFVYLNGKLLAEHKCGYTAFTVDLTESLKPAGEKNILTVKNDSRENLNQPPFGFVIDYMTYGGLYRGAYLEIKNPVHIKDVFVYTEKNHFSSEVTLNTDNNVSGYTLSQEIVIEKNHLPEISRHYLSGEKSSGLQTDSSALQNNSPDLQMDSSVLQNNSPDLQTESPDLQTNSQVQQEKVSELQTDSSPDLQTDSSILQNNSPELQTASNQSSAEELTLNQTTAVEIFTGVQGIVTRTSANASPAIQWTLEKPQLYLLTTRLFDSENNLIDTKTTRFGFRDIKFDQTGFYLNGRKIKLRGLNRHQSFPYTGYAMPDSMQIRDADILKFKLGLNEVRTSHYPQSQAFIDRCDEIGLLVFTEIPGWQFIGNQEWQDQAVENVKEMVEQYRNHPSIFMWGVRINESPDSDSFYARTNEMCHKLDKSRPTGGVRNGKFGNLQEDVFTYNDFSHTGKNPGVLHKKFITQTKKGYMVTEYNGHMFPTKSFDNETIRTEHALRHANVLETVAEYEEIAGSSGWCAFDYNTHKDFGSGDRICYHGVMDMFRNPKPAAAVYSSQADIEQTGVVLEISSSMNIGDFPASSRGKTWIFTNAQSVKMYINGNFIKEYTEADSPYRHLKHPPILIDDYIGNRLETEDGIKPKLAAKLKKIYSEVQKTGPDALDFKTKLKVACMILTRQITMDRLWALGGKYIANWGMSSVKYIFEAYENGKLLKTVIKEACRKVTVKAEASSQILNESKSYDVAAIQLTAEDQHGNIQNYFQEALKLKAEGAVEIIGPEIVSLKGGMAGIFVKSTGKKGKGTLTVEDSSGNTQVIEFTVI